MRHCNCRHRHCQIFVMHHRHACICDHGTGGEGTLTPPLGTTTYRYIFPYSLFGMCTDIHAIWVLAVVLRPSRVPGRRSCQVTKWYLRVVLNVAVNASLPPSTAPISLLLLLLS